MRGDHVHKSLVPVTSCRSRQKNPNCSTIRPLIAHPEYVVFVGRDPEKIGELAEVNDADRLEWVQLSSVPELIAAGKIRNSGSLVASYGC